MTNNKYKVTFYKNENKIKVDYHEFNKFKNRVKPYVSVNRVLSKETWAMTLYQYLATLKRKRKLLHELYLPKDQCVFLTLTTEYPMLYDEIHSLFRLFMRNVNRYFPHTKYIRAIELFEKGIYFHLHILLIFENKVPDKMDEEWIAKHWKHGEFDFQRTCDPYGVIDYITQVKKEKTMIENSNRNTKFPKWIKLITCSQNIPKSPVEGVVYLNKEELDKLRKQFKQTNSFVYVDKHFYIDTQTGEYKECIDHEYWH